MSNPQSTTNKEDAPKRKDWVLQFNQYRATNTTFMGAAQSIWNDWNTAGNIFFELLPNPEALIFSLLTYVPDRAVSPVISATPAPLLPIKWNDAPIYDTFSNAYDGIYAWNCANWQSWHEALEEHYQSTTTANGIWKSAWMHEDNECIVLGTLCPDTSYCRYDCDFVEYFASKNMTVGNLFSNIYCDLSSIVLNLVETIDNVSQGVNNTTKTVAAILPWAAGAGILYGASKIYKGL